MRTGAVRADVHVAAEDLQAAQTYRDALKARQDLWQAGDPFPGHLPDGYLLVNPEGQVVPAAMKTDVLGQVADSPEELAAHIPSIEERGKGIPKEISGYLGDQSNWKRIVADAKATGKLDKLRIIKESEAKRYYAQILPAGQRTAISSQRAWPVKALTPNWPAIRGSNRFCFPSPMGFISPASARAARRDELPLVQEPPQRAARRTQ
jgi:hypothetical protein